MSYNQEYPSAPLGVGQPPPYAPPANPGMRPPPPGFDVNQTQTMPAPYQMQPEGGYVGQPYSYPPPPGVGAGYPPSAAAAPPGGYQVPPGYPPQQGPYPGQPYGQQQVPPGGYGYQQPPAGYGGAVPPGSVVYVDEQQQHGQRRGNDNLKDCCLCALCMALCCFCCTDFD